jgi:hypothetical protein
MNVLERFRVLPVRKVQFTSNKTTKHNQNTCFINIIYNHMAIKRRLKSNKKAPSYNYYHAVPLALVSMVVLYCTHSYFEYAHYQYCRSNLLVRTVMRGSIFCTNMNWVIDTIDGNILNTVTGLAKHMLNTSYFIGNKDFFAPLLWWLYGNN